MFPEVTEARLTNEELDHLWDDPSAEPAEVPAEQAAYSRQSVDGATFILDIPEGLPAIWGEGENVLWPAGEPFMLCGPAGVGKTTIAQQLVLRLIGLGTDLLGFPVQPFAGKVAYLAMDRPAQAARSFARMVTEEDRKRLTERLTVWKGPLPFDLRQDPGALLIHVRDVMGCGIVVIDSLKDLAAELDKDLSAGQVNKAVQMCVASDVEVGALHHQRKGQVGGTKPTTLADVYGSTWITAGMGSVALIWGEPGDPVVELSHLKQPAADVGPLNVLHDHYAGCSTVERGFDLLAYLQTHGGRASAEDVARARFNRTDPSRSQTEKARRSLAAAVRRGLLVAPNRGRGRGRGDADKPGEYVLAARPNETDSQNGENI